MDRVVVTSTPARQGSVSPAPRRIGGEFEVDPVLLIGPQESLQSLPGGDYYATGRGALAAILRELQRADAHEIVLVPDYVCESVVRTVVALGLTPLRYDVTPVLSVDVDALIDLASARKSSLIAAIFVDYFGLSACDDWASTFKAQFPDVPVIRDSVQALYEMNCRASDDYRFSSLRKWLPTPDGAPIAARHCPVPQPTEGECGFVAEKLLGNVVRHWTRDAAPSSRDEAYAHLERGESELEEVAVHPMGMSWASRVILSNVDLEDAARRRRRNFATLATLIAAYGLHPILDLSDDRVPHFLPIRVDDRDRVRATLRAQGIFCPVHWPRPADSRRENDLWDTELSLVIDQRYSVEDMERLSAVLQEAMVAVR